MRIDRNRIYNIDCVEGIKSMMSQGIKADCVLTSPPYNIVRPNANDRGYDGYKDRLMSNDEYAEWIKNMFVMFDSVLSENGKVLWNMSYGSENTECMIKTVSKIIETNFTLADIIVWHKSNATPNNESTNRCTRICEFVYVFVRRNELKTFKANKRQVGTKNGSQPVYENVFNYISARNNDESCPLNKATFSTSLCGQLLDRYCRKGDLILDPFMGTGTTAVAAKGRGMDYLGFELSADQVDWANRRIEGIPQREIKIEAGQKGTVGDDIEDYQQGRLF